MQIKKRPWLLNPSIWSCIHQFYLKTLGSWWLISWTFYCHKHIEKLDPSTVAIAEKILDKKLLLKLKKSKYPADKKNESWQNKRFIKKVLKKTNFCIKI